ncbi:hypothetical protein O9G_000911 [Rozella allomycis CSF55]|uniref:Uncharacterized protein n=1 Tax=Rozella allomycis (strain CSF55) TaxID=988480 RepID=A0A075ARC1_ROZAC|nr:hypothetical protein O9G_000911 [Rozella allomycis CSF55]|eukprot:EPZ31266.1 hypothetical protein O9G_000911 [Rozella allomycis CSF55]
MVTFLSESQESSSDKENRFKISRKKRSSFTIIDSHDSQMLSSQKSSRKVKRSPSFNITENMSQNLFDTEMHGNIEYESSQPSEELKPIIELYSKEYINSIEDNPFTTTDSDTMMNELSIHPINHCDIINVNDITTTDSIDEIHFKYRNEEREQVRSLLTAKVDVAATATNSVVLFERLKGVIDDKDIDLPYIQNTVFTVISELEPKFDNVHVYDVEINKEQRGTLISQRILNNGSVLNSDHYKFVEVSLNSYVMKN